VGIPFTDAFTNLSERPEVMELLVAHFAVVRVVADMLPVAYDEVCDFVSF
jgi:hypothetical protein